MKQVTRCIGCGKVLRTNKGYTVTLTESPIVNGMQMPEVKRESVKLCRGCYTLAGYHPRGKKKEKDRSKPY